MEHGPSQANYELVSWAQVVAVFNDDFPGIGAKGKSVGYTGMALLRLQDGIIVEDAAI